MVMTSQFPGYNTTGIAGLSGGYAYPPGSQMTQFMDSVNATTTSALSGPDGQDVISWANGLMQQAQLRKQAEAAAAANASASTGTGTVDQATMIAQIIQSMIMILSALTQKQA